MKSDVTTIQFRFLEIKKDDSLVLKIDENHKNGYYKFLIKKDELKDVLNSENVKAALFEHFAQDYNRSFMEFLMMEMNLDSLHIASIFIDDTEDEYSYLEAQYMEDNYIYSGVNDAYNEEIGMLSDFDYYPRGLV